MGAASSTYSKSDSVRSLFSESQKLAPLKPSSSALQGHGLQAARLAGVGRKGRQVHRVTASASGDRGPLDSSDSSNPEDVHSFRKKLFGSKPREPGSTRTPRHGDYIDAEWQEFQQRAKLGNVESSSASTSGRFDSQKTDSLSVEDSWDLTDDYTPFPGPGGAISPGDAAIANQWSIGSSFNMAASSELWNRVSQVYVILFGVGKSETEGIYSLRAVTGSDGLPVDTIIAFESGEDAQRYSGLLEAAMSRHVPEVSAIESKDLLDFCADSGYNCRLEPAGTLLMPPEYNVGMTDWERSLRLREGIFNVLPEDPNLQGKDGKQDSQQDAKVPVTPYNGPTLMNQAGAYFPTDIQGLEELKARLEKLLP